MKKRINATAAVTSADIKSANGNSLKEDVIKFRAFEVDINLVEPHPVAMKVYDKKIINGLKLTMELFRQFEPIKVVKRGSKYQIYDGISRYFADIELNWTTILVKVEDYTDEEVQEMFVLNNFHTKRSYKELCKHAEIVLGILGLSQGKKRDRIGGLTAGDTDYGLAGKDRFEIAAEIIGADCSASTLRRLLEVKNFEESGDEEVQELGLMKKIESGEMKVNQALKFMDNYNTLKKEQGSNALTEAVQFAMGKGFKLFNKSCASLEDIPDESIDCVVDSPPYYQQREYPDGVRDTSEPQHGL